MGDRILKLALWHTKTFTPILTHEELEPIMAALGFAPIPITTNPCNSVDRSVISGIAWKEFSYSDCSSFRRLSHLPRPKLPYPVIDGLHPCTYQAFLDSVKFYLLLDKDISYTFHVRGMTLAGVGDRSRNWIPIEESWIPIEENDSYKNNIYVYGEGSDDISVYDSGKARKAYKHDMNNCNSKNIVYNPNIFLGGGNLLAGCKFVPLKNVVVQMTYRK